MIDTFNEHEFRATFDEDIYLAIIKRVFQQIKDTPEFKNDDPFCRTMMIWTVPLSNGIAIGLLIEATAQKLTKNVIDFGITRIQMSDEGMPDEFLDRYNEYIKAKQSTSPSSTSPTSEIK